MPPSVPANFSASLDASGHPLLNWSASSDNVLINGYTIYRDGQVLTTTNRSTLSYTDINVALGATYTYTVDAFDISNNHSAQSSPASVALPSQMSLTFNPVADTWVNASSPTIGYGTSISLQTDGSPIANSYLRFNVQGITGVVTSATLRVYAPIPFLKELEAREIYTQVTVTQML